MPITPEKAADYKWWSDFLDARMIAIQSMIALGRSDIEIIDTISTDPEQHSMLLSEAKTRQGDTKEPFDGA